MSTSPARRTDDRSGKRAPSLDDVQRATLNILEDFGIEKQRMEEVQRASLNILEDFNAEKQRLEDVQRASLNVLEDFDIERRRMEDIRRASLNILEDFDDEKRRLEDVQRASLNILEDLNVEKTRMEDGQRALLNILDDFDAERAKTIAANQQLEATNKELEAFSYSVSHDLRAPLRAVDGFASMVIEDYAEKLDAEGQRLLGVIRRNTQKMGQLIDDLLAFSRMGRREMAFAEIDMTALAADVADELRRQEPGRAIEIAIASLPPAHGDPAMFRQVWANLLSNAIKFTRPRAPARIEVGGRTGGDENVYSVRDNGVGFDMQYREKLFGVFQRLHGPEEFEGTGVGLALVQRIVHRHGGRIWAEGKIDEGATFSFALPNNRPA
jgi:signal transduction histidine kinase